MIKVAALTSGRSVPSSRFRVRQHIAPLREMGIVVREYAPAVEKYAPVPGWMGRLSSFGCPDFLIEHGWRAVKRAARIPGILGSRRSRVTWLERLLLPGYLTAEGLLKQPIVFDVDDAIWLSQPRGGEAAAAIARRAEVVLAGNDYLAGWFSAHNRRVRVVPTAVDTERFRPGRRGVADSFTVGWIGTSGNLPFLEEVQDPLRRFLGDYDDARLLVVSDRPPALRALPAGRVRYLPWSMEGEADALREMDVGLMPLPDNEWTRGKCAFKMLLYMATGLPAVVSPVGMNRDLLVMGNVGMAASDGDGWYEALSWYYENPGRREESGREGRAIAEKRFSRNVVAGILAGIFREFA